MLPNANQIAVTLAGLAFERFQLQEQLAAATAKVADLQSKLEIADAEVARFRELESTAKE